MTCTNNNHKRLQISRISPQSWFFCVVWCCCTPSQRVRPRSTL